MSIIRSIVAPLLLLITLPLHATVYTFTAAEDHLFENPANWYPAFPGTVVKPFDHWVIEAVMYVSVEKIRVEGNLQIGMQGALVGTDFHQTVEVPLGGIIDNGGKAIFKRIELDGNLFNRRSCRFSIDYLWARETALTQNYGHLAIGERFQNEGRFDNYLECEVLGDFRNLAVFNQIRQARLEVSGDIFFQPGCVLTQSAESEIYVGREEKVAIHEQLAAIFQ
ncbi:MAG: hypothetical protein AAFQ87_18525 [Bacteroidota bacterium]